MTASHDLAIIGGRVITPGFEGEIDIGVTDGVITQLGGPMIAAETIDASDRLVLPGGIDPHVHLTPPGTEPGSWRWVDDFTTGTAAAAAGGITTVGNMSFPRRGERMADGLERDLADADANAIVDYFQHPVLLDPGDAGDSTVADQIEALAAAGHPSVKVFMSFRRFDRKADAYVAAMVAAARAGSVVLVHCEDQAIMRCCGDLLAAEGLTEARHYPKTRPVEAERVATERAVGYAATTGAAIYVVHLSSAAALDACRQARARDLPVYVETRPIYLHLEQSRFDEADGAKYTGAPPLRTDADRDRLWAGINDGTVSTVATDHAPWTLAEKLDPTVPVSELRQGLAELETMLPVLWSEGVVKGRISPSRFVEVTSTRAAKLFGLYPRKGAIAPGSDADLVVWDPNETRVVDGSTMHSNAGYSPYDGWEVTGWPDITISRGEVVARRGHLTGRPGRGRLARRQRFTRP